MTGKKGKYISRLDRTHLLSSPKQNHIAVAVWFLQILGRENDNKEWVSPVWRVVVEWGKWCIALLQELLSWSEDILWRQRVSASSNEHWIAQVGSGSGSGCWSWESKMGCSRSQFQHLGEKGTVHDCGKAQSLAPGWCVGVIWLLGRAGSSWLLQFHGVFCFGGFPFVPSQQG